MRTTISSPNGTGTNTKSQKYGIRDHKGHFYCLNCLHLYRREDKLKKHKNVRNSKEGNKKLKHNLGEKSMKFRLLFML